MKLTFHLNGNTVHIICEQSLWTPLLYVYCQFLNSLIAAIYISNHLPWGAPPIVGVGLDSCLMVQQHYVSLYSHELHLPLWTAYKLTRQVRITRATGTCTCV